MAFNANQLTAFFTNNPQMALNAVQRGRLAAEGLGQTSWLLRLIIIISIQPGHQHRKICTIQTFWEVSMRSGRRSRASRKRINHPFQLCPAPRLLCGGWNLSRIASTGLMVQESVHWVTWFARTWRFLTKLMLHFCRVVHIVREGTVPGEMIERFSHTHPLFRADNNMVYSLLDEATRGTIYATNIKPYARTKNGRAAYLAIIGSHAGDDKWEAIEKNQMKFLMNTKWNGKSSLYLWTQVPS